jgi:hypothetical protein
MIFELLVNNHRVQLNVLEYVIEHLQFFAQWREKILSIQQPMCFSFLSGIRKGSPLGSIVIIIIVHYHYHYHHPLSLSSHVLCDDRDHHG